MSIGQIQNAIHSMNVTLANVVATQRAIEKRLGEIETKQATPDDTVNKKDEMKKLVASAELAASNARIASDASVASQKAVEKLIGEIEAKQAIAEKTKNNGSKAAAVAAAVTVPTL